MLPGLKELLDMKSDGSACGRKMSEHLRARAGWCATCGAIAGSMVTRGVHWTQSDDGRAQSQAAWVDHWSGQVRARSNGMELPGGRFLALASPMKVSLVGALSIKRLLCQMHSETMRANESVYVTEPIFETTVPNESEPVRVPVF